MPRTSKHLSVLLAAVLRRNQGKIRRLSYRISDGGYTHILLYQGM